MMSNRLTEILRGDKRACWEHHHPRLHEVMCKKHWERSKRISFKWSYITASSLEIQELCAYMTKRCYMFVKAVSLMQHTPLSNGSTDHLRCFLKLWQVRFAVFPGLSILTSCLGWYHAQFQLPPFNLTTYSKWGQLLLDVYLLIFWLRIMLGTKGPCCYTMQVVSHWANPPLPVAWVVLCYSKIHASSISCLVLVILLIYLQLPFQAGLYL